MWSSGSVNVCRCLPFDWRCLDLKPLRYGFREVGFVNDVVSVEHRPRLPAAEFHDFTLRHATTTKVAGRCAPEIVHESAFEPGLLASPRPNAPKGVDALPAPVKNKQPIPLRPPLLQQLLQLGSETEREHTGVAALGLGRVKPHHLPLPIHLVPREVERLGLPPARQTQEANHGPQV